MKRGGDGGRHNKMWKSVAGKAAPVVKEVEIVKPTEEPFDREEFLQHLFAVRMQTRMDQLSLRSERTKALKRLG